MGGGQLPQVVTQASQAWFQAANIATCSYPFLSIAHAGLLLAHGDDQLVETWVRSLIEGRFTGTMCSSEPEAGSSLTDLSTRALLDEGDPSRYRLFGNKMWISGGDHELSENIVHLVLAKTPGGPPGVKGLCEFVVPKYLLDEHGATGERNDVVLAGLNHKMGCRGTTNTLLNFGEGTHRPAGRAGAVGYLVGKAHHGLSYMFHMMNEARIGVGSAAMALGFTGYLKSLNYARSRVQGRPVTAKDPNAPPVPIIEHPMSGGCCSPRSLMLKVRSAWSCIVVAWLWLEQMLSTRGKTGDFYDGKRQAARYFFRFELPRVDPQLDLLCGLDRTTLDNASRVVLNAGDRQRRNGRNIYKLGWHDGPGCP